LYNVATLCFVHITVEIHSQYKAPPTRNLCKANINECTHMTWCTLLQSKLIFCNPFKFTLRLNFHFLLFLRFFCLKARYLNRKRMRKTVRNRNSTQLWKDCFRHEKSYLSRFIGKTAHCENHWYIFTGNLCQGVKKINTENIIFVLHFFNTVSCMPLTEAVHS